MIDQLNLMKLCFLADVVGIFVFAEEARKTSTNKLVRECSMIDQSEKTVSVYFWEKDAENFQLPLKVPIGLRKVQVKDYGNEKVLWFQRISAADVSITGKTSREFCCIL